MAVEEIQPFKYGGLSDLISRTFEKPTEFKNDPFVVGALRISVLFFLLEFLFLAYNLRFLPSEVPLFYSLPWGEKRLAPFQFLFLLPGLTFFVMLINFYFAKKLYVLERLLSRICSFTALVVSFLSLVTLCQIIFIIT